MRGRLANLYRYPVKGFTAEPLDAVSLQAGRCFPCDRLFAVEDGPSGFDPAQPKHISKMKFAVLAKIPEVALVRTRYDEAKGELLVEAAGQAPFRAVLQNQTGRIAFADWLQSYLGEMAGGALRVLEAPGDHRFMDDRRGFVSVINMASVRALEAKIGRSLDPLRFRANLYVEGWDAWAENEAIGGEVRIGDMRARVLKPTGRCRATHVDPHKGVEDIDLVSQLFNHFGHTVLGVYLEVEAGGRISIGDGVQLVPREEAA
jgi:uncharacterized protein